MASGLPRYVSYRGHGATSVSAPVTISDSLFRCFAFKSDGNQVQQFLDQTLNRATPEIQYRVLGGYVFIVIAENGKVQSPDNIGWDPDNEVAAFIPVLEERPPLLLPEKLAMWVPYLLIDTSIGMITGREVWGFNKSLMTEFDDTGGKLIAKTEVFAHLNQTQRGQNEPLLSITPWTKKSAFLSAQSATTANPLTSAVDVFNTISNNLPNWLVNSPALNLSGLGSLTLQPDIPLPIINLKEVRDAQHTRRAGLMQLVECYGQVNGNMSGGEIPNANSYTLTINDYESHQLVKDLGILGGTVGATSVSVSPDFAFWLYMDWIMPPGRIIYSNI